MKIIKAGKVLTSEALNAEMIINENQRKENEIVRQANNNDMVEATQATIDATADAEAVVAGKTGLNDATISTTEGWSSSKINQQIGGLTNLQNTVNNHTEKIGDLSLLETTSNTDLVGAINENTLHLADMSNEINSKFITRLTNGQITKIKLIGDSITDGNGARNYTAPLNTNTVIFNDGVGNIFYEPNISTNGWAQKFKSFINSDYPTVQFTNAAIGGRSTKQANATKQYWVSDTEDVVFVMLGTNDRWDCATPAEFKIELEAFLTYVKANSNLMIVMTAPPTQSDTDTETYNFGMKEVDRVITEVCQRNSYIHISLYRGIFEYAENTGSIISSIIERNGTHPNDEGYAAMWKIIQQRLGFSDGLANWASGSPSNLTVFMHGNNFPYLQSADPITCFAVGKETVIETYGTYTDTANFPEASSGRLKTVRGLANDLYSYQIFEPRESYNIYKRTWNYGTTAWNAWVKTSASTEIHDKATITITPGSISANSVGSFEVLYIGLNNTYTPIITISGVLPAGAIATAHVDYVANRVYVRIYNTTAAPITVGSLIISCIQLK